MKGIILAGEQGDVLFPITLGIPKQLIPVYDKPMIYYPIETLVEAGIKDILIITSPQYVTSFVNTLGDGIKFGAHFTYMTQTSPEGAAQAFTIGEEFLGKDSVCLITGDCIILGDERSAKLKKAIRAAQNSGHSTIFVTRDYDPNQYGTVKLDEKGKCEQIEGKSQSRSYYSITGLYVFPKGVSNYVKVINRSERGRLEITSLNQVYFEKNKLQVQILGSDFKWFDTNSFDNLLTLSKYVQLHSKL